MKDFQHAVTLKLSVCIFDVNRTEINYIPQNKELEKIA